MTEHEKWECRARDYGLEPSKTRSESPDCPRRLAGKVCRVGSPRYSRCYCQSPLNDHGRAWRHAHGDEVVLWEPYSISPVELARVWQLATDDGLSVSVTAASPYYPGCTIAVQFKAAAHV